jgi:2-methylcitrate dehydratase PrpD
MTGEPLAQILGDFAHGLSFESLPSDVVDRAMISLADGVACAFVGMPLPSSKWALEYWQGARREGESTVWVNGEKGDFETTAWINCLLMHSILHDDTQNSTVGHMGSIIIPTAVAISEKNGKSGRELLTAMVSAYEVSGRIGVESGESIVERGFRGSPVFGTFAAATVAGKLEGLTGEEIARSIALAANFSSGLLHASNAGSMEWRFQNGVALRNGIMAAQLAKTGVPGAPSTLEGECGFFYSFAGPEIMSDLASRREELTRSLGTEFEITKNVLKPYATCGYNQIGAEVARVMVDKNDISPEEVKEVRVFVSPANKAYPGVDFHGPFSAIDQALLSKPFSIAAILKYRDLGVDCYLSSLDDPEIGGLAKKVLVEDVEGMAFLDTKIEFELSGGRVISGDQGLIDMNKFSLDRESIVDKFCRLTSKVMDRKTSAEIVTSIFRLPEMSDVREFTEKLRELPA